MKLTEGPQMKHYDIVIKNGQIYDGTGNAPYHADIAIHDGKIAAIEPALTDSAAVSYTHLRAHET